MSVRIFGIVRRHSEVIHSVEWSGGRSPSAYSLRAFRVQRREEEKWKIQPLAHVTFLVSSGKSIVARIIGACSGTSAPDPSAKCAQHLINVRHKSHCWRRRIAVRTSETELRAISLNKQCILIPAAQRAPAVRSLHLCTQSASRIRSCSNVCVALASIGASHRAKTIPARCIKMIYNYDFYSNVSLTLRFALVRDHFWILSPALSPFGNVCVKCAVRLLAARGVSIGRFAPPTLASRPIKYSHAFIVLSFKYAHLRILFSIHHFVPPLCRLALWLDSVFRTIVIKCKLRATRTIENP